MHSYRKRRLKTQLPHPIKSHAAGGRAEARGCIPARCPSGAREKGGQESCQKGRRRKKANRRRTAPAVTQAQRDAYAAIPVVERLAIQSDLIWSGDLAGAADPDFSDRAIAAVRTSNAATSSRKPVSSRRTSGRCSPPPPATRKDYVGWRLVEDDATPGVRLGIPSEARSAVRAGARPARAGHPRGARSKSRPFREKMAGATLNELFEDLKKKPASRRVEFTSVQGNTFLISGLQGLKRLHVRVFMKDNEARGLTILYDQAMEGIVLPMVDYDGQRLCSVRRRCNRDQQPARCNTDRALSSRNRVMSSPIGSWPVIARRSSIAAVSAAPIVIADDKATDLTLLQVNGASNLNALVFSSRCARECGPHTARHRQHRTRQAGARDVTSVERQVARRRWIARDDGCAACAWLHWRRRLRRTGTIRRHDRCRRRNRDQSIVVRSDEHNPQDFSMAPASIPPSARATSPLRRTRSCVWCV